jgi:hypothetical protein
LAYLHSKFLQTDGGLYSRASLLARDQINVAWKLARDRELKDSALFALLAMRAEQNERLAEMSLIVDFFVGRSDSLGLPGMQAALKAVGIGTIEELQETGALNRIFHDAYAPFRLRRRNAKVRTASHKLATVSVRSCLPRTSKEQPPPNVALSEPPAAALGRL